MPAGKSKAQLQQLLAERFPAADVPTVVRKLAGNEIGSRIGFAWDDDAMALVELAERNGFRSRNFVSSIVDRLKSSAIPLERNRQPPSDTAKVLERARSPIVWIFVDDVDRNFDGKKRDEIKIAALFDACRTLSRH